MFQAQDEAILVSFEEALTQSALSSSTIINYLADLRAFLRWGTCEIDSEFSLLIVNQAHIRLYRDYLSNKLKRAVSTVNRHLMALRKFFVFAKRVGVISVDPMGGVALVQGNGQTTSGSLSEEAAEKLFAAAQNGTRAGLVRRDVAILQLLLQTGLRVSELTNLQQDDLIFDHPGVRLKVCHPQDKTKMRYLPLSGEICRVLNNYLSVRPQSAMTGHIFLNQRGQPISDRTVQRVVSDCAKTAGLAGVSAQTLRRTFALQLLSATNDLELVSERLGHQTKAITAQYLARHK